MIDIFNLSNSIQTTFISGQLLVAISHGNPVSIHLAPLVFGETSPSFEFGKAATNAPY